MRTILLFCVLNFLIISFSGCTKYERQSGVDNIWRKVDISDFTPGVTTQSEIAKRLGPPSQIINMDAGPVFYYLTEMSKGNGYILILFNSFNEKRTYDRAIFFFDTKGILSDYALSHETLPEKK